MDVAVKDSVPETTTNCEESNPQTPSIVEEDRIVNLSQLKVVLYTTVYYCLNFKVNLL